MKESACIESRWGTGSNRSLSSGGLSSPLLRPFCPLSCFWAQVHDCWLAAARPSRPIEVPDACGAELPPVASTSACARDMLAFESKTTRQMNCRQLPFACPGGKGAWHSLRRTGIPTTDNALSIHAPCQQVTEYRGARSAACSSSSGQVRVKLKPWPRTCRFKRPWSFIYPLVAIS